MRGCAHVPAKAGTSIPGEVLHHEVRCRTFPHVQIRLVRSLSELSEEPNGYGVMLGHSPKDPTHGFIARRPPPSVTYRALHDFLRTIQFTFTQAKINCLISVYPPEGGGAGATSPTPYVWCHVVAQEVRSNVFGTSIFHLTNTNLHYQEQCVVDMTCRI